MAEGDQAESGTAWRAQLRDMRTLNALRRSAPAAEALRRLSDRALHAAAHNPDHSEAARAAALEELRARGASAQGWRIAVPGFIRAADLAAHGEKLFFGWGRAVRRWSGALVFASLLAIFVWAFIAVWRSEQAGLGQPEPPPQMVVVAWLWLAALGVWFAATALRRRPARVLLLRKFNVRAVSEPLERMIAHELRPYGHVVSLSDKHIRRDRFGWVQTALLSLSNPLAALWFVVGLPVRFVWRLFDRSAMGPAVVLNARDYRNLARRLRDRIGLNLQTALVSKEAFLVRTSDAWWRMVVRLLMESSDAIVVDLSQVSEGTAWELDVIRDEGAGPRCVCVSIWGKAEAAQAALRARGFDQPVFHYAPDGEMQRRGEFRAAMLASMRATHRVPA